MTDPLAARVHADMNIIQKIELSLRCGQILGPDYDGVPFEDVCRELVQLKARAARVHADLNGTTQTSGTTEPFVDTPLLQAKRLAFDYPNQANLDALITASQAETAARLQALIDQAFRAGYHCLWLRAERGYVFDPVFSPGDPEGALEAWKSQTALEAALAAALAPPVTFSATTVNIPQQPGPGTTTGCGTIAGSVFDPTCNRVTFENVSYVVPAAALATHPEKE